MGGTIGGVAFGAGGWGPTVAFTLALLAVTAGVGASLRTSAGGRSRTP